MMKKGFFVLFLLLVFTTWVEAQVFQIFTVKKFVRIEFESIQAFPGNWIQSSPGEGGCVSYTAISNSPVQSLTLLGADGLTQQHFVNAGQIVFVCGDVAHIPPRVN
jgi:hypothetical protein